MVLPKDHSGWPRLGWGKNDNPPPLGWKHQGAESIFQNCHLHTPNLGRNWTRHLHYGALLFLSYWGIKCFVPCPNCVWVCNWWQQMQLGINIANLTIKTTVGPSYLWGFHDWPWIQKSKNNDIYGRPGSQHCQVSSGEGPLYIISVHVPGADNKLRIPGRQNPKSLKPSSKAPVLSEGKKFNTISLSKVLFKAEREQMGKGKQARQRVLLKPHKPFQADQ